MITFDGSNGFPSPSPYVQLRKLTLLRKVFGKFEKDDIEGNMNMLTENQPSQVALNWSSCRHNTWVQNNRPRTAYHRHCLTCPF